MPFSLEINTPDSVVAQWPEALRSAGPAWLEAFGSYMTGRTMETFSALAFGGSYRGVAWPYFSRRPSARRGGMSARLLDYTGRLKSSIGAVIETEAERMTLRAGAPYAARQQQMRPFLFFQTPDDSNEAARIAAEFISKALSVDESKSI